MHDVGIRLYDDVGSELPIPKLEDASYVPERYELSSAILGLAALTSQLHLSMRKFSKLSPDRRDRYEISREDLDRNTNPGIEGGLADLHFAIGFIPAIAVHITHQMIDEGLLTENQRN